MGCGAGKEAVEVQRGAGDERRREVPNPLARRRVRRRSLSDDSDSDLDVTLAPMRSRYWNAGSVQSTASAPHFVPIKGPWSTSEKCPASPASVVGTVLCRLQHIAEPTPAFMLVDVDDSEDPEELAAVFCAPKPPPAAAAAEDAGATPKNKPPLAPLNPNALEKAPKGKAAAGGGVAMANVPRPPPLHAREEAMPFPFLPNPVPRILPALPTIKGRLEAPRSPGDYAQCFSLPSQWFAGRAMLPHSLCNYTVGWVKLPTGPANANAKLGEAQGAEAAGGNADSSEGLGYLSSSKPLYDVSVDGTPEMPVGSSSEKEEEEENQAEAHLERHLQQHFLYPERVERLAIDVGFQVDGLPFHESELRTKHCIPTEDDVAGSELEGAFFSTTMMNSAAYEENSVALPLLGHLSSQYSWWNDLVTDSKGGGSAPQRESVKGAIERMGLSERRWLAFRWRFVAGLREAVAKARSTATANGIVTVGVQLGVRFSYDNTSFVAYNSNNTIKSTNYVFDDQLSSMAATAGHSFLRFVDRSRSPAVAVSDTIAKGKIDLRMRSTGEADTALTVLHEECVALQHLHQQYLDA